MTTTRDIRDLFAYGGPYESFDTYNLLFVALTSATFGPILSAVYGTSLVSTLIEIDNGKYEPLSNSKMCNSRPH